MSWASENAHFGGALLSGDHHAAELVTLAATFVVLAGTLLMRLCA